MTPAPMEEGGWLGPLAGSLAEALPRLYGEPLDPLVREVILALGAGLGQGLLELSLTGPAPPGVDAAAWPEGHRQALSHSRLSREPDGPLLLSDGAVAWRRWRDQRDRLLADLLARAAHPPAWACRIVPANAGGTEPPPAADSLTAAGAADATEHPFAASGSPTRRGRRRAQQTAAKMPAAPQLDPQQLQAVAALGRHGLVLLEGGPGTGKTSTVRALLTELRRHHPQARIQLAAPTGKAAARLRGACGGADPCTTLHRLLESRGDRFLRNRRNPLDLDLLVVDEVSMVDQALMAALLAALPPSCQLVLVGDRAQLPPIAPGAVLQDLQHPAVRERLGLAAVTLTRVHRNAGSIAAVAARLRQGLSGDVPPLSLVRPLLEQLGRDDNLSWQQASSGKPPMAALTAARRQQQQLAKLARRWLEATEAERPALQRQLLRERERLLLLTPRRRGRWGVEGLHEQLLGARAQGPAEQWPSGTPVLCCRNLPELGLANGDLGVLVGAEESARQRRLLFEIPGEAEEVIALHPALLAGALEPALAMTVHKAQGSEAEAVIVLLADPEASDGRLLYTALTRARQRALLITGRPPEAAPGVAPGSGST